ncbi:hypothetical protein GHK86_11965 [Acidimicrobiaceae bacterium USS-CC1]|uniref:Uncharacterized protein n=1 Tax=Acidiferrimicrobium australe TaxID=2664430 RepID=A0ABW9QVP6_9ACTN|nr:hypothetical protein [Acidiferrimicrobium australe]
MLGPQPLRLLPAGDLGPGELTDRHAHRVGQHHSGLPASLDGILPGLLRRRAPNPSQRGRVVVW